MGVLVANDILMDVAYALIEQPVQTTLLTPIAPGTQTVGVASLTGIYQGAQLVLLVSPVDTPGSQTEVVTVLAVGASTITITVQFQHSGGTTLVGPTFPSGVPDHQLFTQTEMLGYLADVQNDFLLRVRPIYVVGTVAAKPNTAVYANPSDAIRVERVAIKGAELSSVTQTDIDWIDPGFRNAGSSPPGPCYWYQDGIAFASFGVAPPPQRQDTMELFYAQRGPVTLTGLLDPLMVPDVMKFIFKFGVLARAWSKDGDQRDPERAAACQTMYEMFCMVSAKFMQGVIARMGNPEETVEPLIGSTK